MMKKNTCFKGDEGLCVDLLITNSKFPFMTTKFFETDLSDHHNIYYSQNKIYTPQFQTIYVSDWFKLDIFNSMSAMKIHSAFENNFVPILD